MTSTSSRETLDRILWLAAVLLVVYGAVRTGQATVGLGFEAAEAMGPAGVEPPPPRPAQTAEERAFQERHAEWRREMSARSARREIVFAARGLAQSVLWLVAGWVLLGVARRRLSRYDAPS